MATLSPPVFARSTRGKTTRGRWDVLDAWLCRAERRLLQRNDGVFADAAVVDVGMGECPWTTLDLARAVRSVQRGLRVVGVEVDARRALAAKEIAGAEIDVRVGGFALAGVEQWRVVRAVNVLRQYSPGEVSRAHAALSEGLAPGGVILEGTSSKRGDSFAVLVLRRMATGLVREALVFHCACAGSRQFCSGTCFRGTSDAASCRAPGFTICSRNGRGRGSA